MSLGWKRLMGAAKAAKQELAEVVGYSERTEYPADFVREEAAVRATCDLTDALVRAIHKYAEGSFTYAEPNLSALNGSFVERASYTGTLGRSARSLARVLGDRSTYRSDLLALSKAAKSVEALEALIAKELNLTVVGPYKYFLKGTGNDFVRERRKLAHARLALDASGGGAEEREAFEEQMSAVRALMDRVPAEVEEHRLLVRKFAALLAAHSLAVHNIYNEALKTIDASPSSSSSFPSK